MQQITLKRGVAARRGLWCNLCGSALTTAGIGRGQVTGRRRIDWLEAAGKTSTWSLCEECYKERLRCAACGSHVGSHAVLLLSLIHI